MKFFILVATLLASLSVNAGDCYKQESTEEFDSPIAYMDEDENIVVDNYVEDFYNDNPEMSEEFQRYQDYDDKLNAFLQESSDVKIQLIALLSKVDESNLAKAKDILKTVINLDSDKYTLFLAARVCHTFKKLTSWCHKNEIHKTHYQVDSDNLFTYLFNIHTNDKPAKIEDTILQAANNSTYANSYFFEYVIEHANQIDLFNENNPEILNEYLGLNDLESSNDLQEIEDEIATLQLVEKGLISPDYTENLNNNNSIIIAIGHGLLQTTSFSPLLNNCKKEEIAEPCIQIAKLLLDAKTLMNQMLGSSLMTQSQKLLGVDEKTIQKTKTIMEQKHSSIACYVGNTDAMLVQIINKDIATKYILDAKQFGEIEAFKRQAFHIYNIEKQHGFNPGFNPNDC